jgi:DNA-binding SARP family transcriptional activator
VASGVEFKVLGPLQVVGPDGAYDLGAPKHRALLGLLLLEPGRVVSVDRLIDQLWHGEPPAAATSTLQAYVSNLRRVLEPGRKPGAPATLLVTRPPGYALDIEPAQVDAVRFEQSLRSALRAHEQGALDAAASELEAALALWRGSPYADCATEPWALTECERLGELRLVALETQLAIDLDRGRHAQVVGEAERLCKEHPVRERLRELLMLALYRSGRQAEALRAYQDARDVLVEELGIEPGPALRALEDRILAQDPTLDWQGPPAGTVAAAPAAGAGAPVAVDAAALAAAPEAALAPERVFVGRHDEQVRLTTRLAEALNGAPRLALVSGEPGIGKTRFCESVADAARALGAHPVWARGWEGEGAPAFWPWVQVLRTLVEDLPRDVLAAAAEAGAADIARVVPEYARLASGDGPAPDAETARFRFFDAVANLLRRLGADRPLLVVLDDLHWADQSSLRLLEFVVASMHDTRVMVVGTFRDAEARVPPLAGCLATLARTPDLERLTLSGLTVDEVEQYVSAVAGDVPDRALAGSLHGRTAGNPFFVGELLRLLRHEGRLGAQAAGSAPVPEGVRDVVRTRLARLPEEAIPVLTAGAVAGREFDIALVAHVCGIDEDRALDLLEAAWMIGVVDEHDVYGHFKFTHELVRETLCDDLSALRRTRLHRRIGEAIETLHGERNPGFLTACAYHFAQAAPAGDPLKAVLYGQRAADRLVAQYAYEDAIPIYERAIELYEQYDVGSYQTQIDLLIGLGWALRASGRLADARKVLRRAMERSEAEADEIRIARAVLGIGGGSFWGWWDEFGVADEDLVQYLERALEKLGDDDSVLRCELLARLAIESYVLTDREQRDWMTAEALAMARRLDDPVALCAALAARHLVTWRIDNLAERVALADELVAVAQQHEIRYAELIGRHFRMVDALERADAELLESDYVACEELAETLGQHAFKVQLAWFRAARAQFRGDLDEAERLVREAFELNAASAESAAVMAYGAQLFGLRREQGRLAEMEPLIRSAMERQPHVGYAWRISLAMVLIHTERGDEARALLEPLREPGLPALQGNDLLFPTFLVRLAEITAVLGDADWADMLLPEFDAFAGEVSVLATGHLSWGAVARHRGELLRALGRLDEAEAAYRHAIAVDERIGARIWALRARLGLALTLAARGDGAGAATLAAEVESEARSLGAVGLAEAAAAVADEPHGVA